jgi:hypothetical protein
VAQIGNGQSEVDTSLVAAHLKANAKSTDFLTKFTSAKLFGIIEGRGSFQLTATAKDYFLPTGDSANGKSIALLKFFGTPAIYQSLISTYDGSKPPSTEIIGNLLSQRHGVPSSWKARVAANFLSSAETAGVIAGDGFLRFKAKIQTPGFANETKVPIVNGIREPGDALTAGTGDIQEDVEQAGVIVWKYPFQGKNLRIETPENLTKEIWEKLNKYIQVLKP